MAKHSKMLQERYRDSNVAFPDRETAVKIYKLMLQKFANISIEISTLVQQGYIKEDKSS